MIRNPFTTAATAALCLAFALVADVADADADATTSKGDACREIQKLQTLYLNCERTAQTTRMDGDETARCSEIYYELKAKAFGDDFARFRDWYDLMMSVGGPDVGAVSAPGSMVGGPTCG